MPLSPRQELSYNHLADLYRPGRQLDADGKPRPESYTLAYSGVRCRFEIKQSVSIASLIARLEGDQSDTVDIWHGPEDQEIDENWLIHNVSVLPDGVTPDENNGRWWICRGQPQKFARSARRQGGKVAIRCSQEKYVALGVS